jgi:hypothetical protein
MYIGFTQIDVLKPGSGVSETIALLEPWVLQLCALSFVMNKDA